MESSNAKKQIPLRLSPELYIEIAAWAEDDFRSVNAQIEFLLTESVRARKASRELHRVTNTGFSHLIGHDGIAQTILRPAGRATIDGAHFDVITNGDFVTAGEALTVIEVQGNRIVVEPKGKHSAEKDGQ